MNKNIKLILVVVFICVFFSSKTTFGETPGEGSPETLAVTLVIDTSGSMAKTDPNNLRETAANIFIDLLSPEDYLSIITFNSKEKVVIPMQKIDSINNKEIFKKELSQNLQANGDTDYLRAFNEGSKQLKLINDGRIKKVIVFLTDGEPDPNSLKKNDSKFFNSYMESLWEKVSYLALNKYPVYSIGFSEGVDSKVLEKISNTTGGDFKISDDSSEIAINFFEILGDLKNRVDFLDKTYELNGNASIEFDIDEYTSQTTMVFTNPLGKPFDVTLFSPGDIPSKDIVTTNKSQKYTIVTVNGENEKIKGKWKVNLKGEGNIRAFGNRDLVIKSWISNPLPNSLHPLNEPLEISAKITGKFLGKISMEAILTKEGIKDEVPIELVEKDGVFNGTYRNVDKKGKYDIEIRLIINGNIITKNYTSLYVRELPSISTNFGEKNRIYRLGENFIVTSYLNLTGNKIINNADINIDKYNLLLDYSKSGIDTISLLDSGLKETGDAKAKDGIWSNKVLFNKEDIGKASLVVKGTYKGEEFLLEKYLGSFSVYSSGKLLIKPLNSTLITYLDRQIKIPLEIENTSNFTETIFLSLDKNIGQLSQDRIKIEPLKKIKTFIYLKLEENLENKVYDIVFKVKAENIETKVLPIEFNQNIEVVSKTRYLLKNIKYKMIPIFYFLRVVTLILLFVILLGLLLYKLLVYKNTIIKGKLIYWKEEDSKLEGENEFNFNIMHKNKIIISFNEENKNAEYHIFHSKYIYDIELSKIVKKSRWKFIDGIKGVFYKNTLDLVLKTTEPGIFIYEDKIFTSKEIHAGDMFITGGYVFKYIWEK